MLSEHRGTEWTQTSLLRSPRDSWLDVKETLLNSMHRSLHLLVFWILFENVMSLHRTKATFIGLLEAGRVNEWVVTEKLGDGMKTKAGAKAAKIPRIRIGER